MRPWASWTAKTAVLTLAGGLAATAGGLSGVALAASGGSAALAAVDSGASASDSGASASQAAAPAGMPDDVCSDAGALLGLADAACQSVALPGVPGAGAAQTGRPAAGPGNASAGQGAGQGVDATVGQVAQRAVAPVTSVLGAAGSVPAVKTAPLTAVTGHRPTSWTTGTGGASASRTDSTTGNTPAARAGDTNVPAATQLAGLGALPGLADLPSSAGLASTPARNGAMGGGNPIPGTALSAANSGMSSDSFAALAVGALLAGASALKIASRRTRDRKAGIGVTQ
jgi:hypothetical protein